MPRKKIAYLQKPVFFLKILWGLYKTDALGYCCCFYGWQLSSDWARRKRKESLWVLTQESRGEEETLHTEKSNDKRGISLLLHSLKWIHWIVNLSLSLSFPVLNWEWIFPGIFQQGEFHLTYADLQLTLPTDFITLFAIVSVPRMHGWTETEEITRTVPLQRCCCCCAPTSLHRDF